MSPQNVSLIKTSQQERNPPEPTRAQPNFQTTQKKRGPQGRGLISNSHVHMVEMIPDINYNNNLWVCASSTRVRLEESLNTSEHKSPMEISQPNQCQSPLMSLTSPKVLLCTLIPTEFSQPPLEHTCINYDSTLIWYCL